METSHRPVRSGALTLLFTVVLLCLAVLAVLSLATARADEAWPKKAWTGWLRRPPPSRPARSGWLPWTPPTPVRCRPTPSPPGTAGCRPS